MAPQKYIIINAARMSMRGNLLTGAYLKTIAASFLARMLVGFRGIPGIVLAPTSRRSAKPNTGKRNQYAIGSELVESFFHLGFKLHASTKTPQHWRSHNRTLNDGCATWVALFSIFRGIESSFGVDSESKHKTIGKFWKFYALQERPCRFSGICRILGKNRSATYARPGVLFSILQKGLRASDRLSLTERCVWLGDLTTAFPTC
jgi:hypothetical protein